MEATPEKRLGFSCGRGSPLLSVLVDPFNSVARRLSASPRENGSSVRYWRNVFPGARAPELHEIAIRTANPMGARRSARMSTNYFLGNQIIRSTFPSHAPVMMFQ
jgi:hypothetical protein